MLRFNSVLTPFIKINSIGSMEINWKEKDKPECLHYFHETKSFIWRVNGKYLAIWGHLAKHHFHWKDAEEQSPSLPTLQTPRSAQWCWNCEINWKLSWSRIRLQSGRPGFDPWVGKIPWRRERLRTPVFWPGEFHGLYSPRGHKESDTTEPLSLSCPKSEPCTQQQIRF